MGFLGELGVFCLVHSTGLMETSLSGVTGGAGLTAEGAVTTERSYRCHIPGFKTEFLLL